MAATKSYNPVIKIEGMFNGCVMRIAQAIKDPVDFGESTRLVIQECAKQYQDALDDCEIQILDAKWYLEHQLALNKAKREAKSREETAAVAKRKHNQIQDAGDKDDRDADAKRVRLTTPQPETAKKLPESAKNAKPTPEPPKFDPPAPPPEPAHAPEKMETKPEQPLIKKPPEPVKAPEKPPEQPTEEPPSQTMTEFPQSTPQLTPAPTNDEFNFVSMFGEPSQDVGEAEDDNDMNFDLDLGDGFGSNLGGGGDDNQNPGDLDALLPGLESYANQTENENADNSNNNQINFDLPALGGPNEFDDFLNANPFDAAGMDPGEMNLTDEALNMENMENMDFDSMFND